MTSIKSQCSAMAMAMACSVELELGKRPLIAGPGMAATMSDPGAAQTSVYAGAAIDDEYHKDKFDELGFP